MFSSCLGIVQVAIDCIEGSAKLNQRAISADRAKVTDSLPVIHCTSVLVKWERFWHSISEIYQSDRRLSHLKAWPLITNWPSKLFESGKFRTCDKKPFIWTLLILLKSLFKTLLRFSRYSLKACSLNLRHQIHNWYNEACSCHRTCLMQILELGFRACEGPVPAVL